VSPASAGTRLPFLDAVRVVEVGDSLAVAFCGKVLADLGADVVMIEPAGGRALRPLGPGGGPPGPERSVLDAWLSANKRSLTLAAGAEDRAILQALVGRADLVLRSPGAPEVAGLQAANPGLTVVTISPFGTTGPYAAYPANDLSLFALSGFSFYVASPADDPARLPPKENPGQQVALVTGLSAAIASLWGLAASRRKGQGVALDVSEWEAFTHLLYEHTAQLSDDKLPATRQRRPGAVITVVGGLILCLPCTDGWVLASPREDHQFKVWGELLGDPAWAARPEFANPVLREQHGWEIFERSAAWTRPRRQAEVYLAAQEKKIACFPVNRMTDLLEMEQLRHRGFWAPLDHPLAGRVAAPGIPARVSGPELLPSRPAPTPGAHAADIRAELRTAPTAAPGQHDAVSAGGTYQQVLAGVRVVDFSWVVAGPFCTKLLALMGAEVIKVESAKRAQYKERGAWFSILNNSKKSCTLNLATDAGRAIVTRLIGMSDVLVENFSTGVMERLGLGYEALRAIRSGLVYVSSSGVGRTGPGRNWLAYGSLLQGLSGWTSLFSAPNPKMEGMGIAPSWTDPLTGLWEALIIQAALVHRRRTGQGLFVDLSMLESTIPLMGDVFLEAVTQTRSGAGAAPQGVGVPRGIYPCREDDSWIAISACEPREWEALCKALDAPAWCRADELRTPDGRGRRREQVDRWLAEQTARRAAGELFHQLEAAGVPAAPCYRLPEILADVHMQARGLFREVATPGGKAQLTTGLPWLEEGSDWKGLLAPAPALGQHNDYVFREVLGLSEAECAAYRREGVIE
jgi:benzylsuccinate CoA-transferase BbsF subunit